MGYFKRRVKDSWQITKEIGSGLTWKNAIIMIPGLFLLIPFVWFLMLFEDYEEIDRHENDLKNLFKSK